MTRTNVYCTNCGGEFIAELDMGLDGNHEITCPGCQHVHYRVVKGGEVTEERWRSSSGPVFAVTTWGFTNSTASDTTTTTYDTTSGSPFLAQSWVQSASTNLR